MVHSNSNCLTGVNKFLKRNPCQGCFTDTSAYQCPCVVFCHKKPWKFTAAASACWFQLWFYLAWLLLLWFAWVPLENAGAMMFVEKAAVALDLWKDLVSTEWLWPFLPDIYQSKRRWELSSYIYRNTVARFVSIVRSSQPRRVLWTLGSCGCTHCHIGSMHFDFKSRYNICDFFPQLFWSSFPILALLGSKIFWEQQFSPKIAYLAKKKMEAVVDQKLAYLAIFWRQ